MSSPKANSLFDFPQSFLPIFPVLNLLSYFSVWPVVKWLAGPGGMLCTSLVALLSQAASKLSGEEFTDVHHDPRKLVVVLTGIYIILVYIFSAVMSVTGLLMGNKEGYRNREPRALKRHVAPGLPLRMISAHDALYDIFPAYGVTAALVVCYLPFPGATAAKGVNPEFAVNALALHVFFKICVYIPAYVFDFDLIRSVSHMCAVGALPFALWGVLGGV